MCNTIYRHLKIGIKYLHCSKWTKSGIHAPRSSKCLLLSRSNEASKNTEKVWAKFRNRPSSLWYTHTDGPTHNRRFNAEVKIFLFLSVATTLIKNNSDALGVSLTHSPPIRQGGNYFVYYVMIRETDPLPHCSFTNTFPRKWVDEMRRE